MQIMVNTFDCRISVLVHGFLLILMHFLMWKKKSSEKLVCVLFVFYFILHKIIYILWYRSVTVPLVTECSFVHRSRSQLCINYVWNVHYATLVKLYIYVCTLNYVYPCVEPPTPF